MNGFGLPAGSPDIVDDRVGYLDPPALSLSELREGFGAVSGNIFSTA